MDLSRLGVWHGRARMQVSRPSFRDGYDSRGYHRIREERRRSCRSKLNEVLS